MSNTAQQGILLGVAYDSALTEEVNGQSVDLAKYSCKETKNRYQTRIGRG
jgi:hypothetical protein